MSQLWIYVSDSTVRMCERSSATSLALVGIVGILGWAQLLSNQASSMATSRKSVNVLVTSAYNCTLWLSVEIPLPA